ncbi:MAG: DUF2489 domain-containing protein [Pseudomonadota bacterium]|nr:DUF2489 domain-containing protein [Pseudomonadota bacterium]
MAFAWQVLCAALAGLVIGSLLGLVGWRWWLARRHKTEQRVQQSGVLDSLEVLCKALEQQQVEVSEAAIRVSALLDTLPASISPKVDLSDIHQFAQTCQQFDRGEARHNLTPKARHEQDKYRWQLDEENRERIRAAAQRLVTVLPDWRSGLGISSPDK